MTTSPTSPQKAFAEWVASTGVGIDDVAARMKMSPFHLGEILNERNDVTPKDAEAMAAISETSPEYWLKMRNDYLQWLSTSDGTHDSKTAHFHRYLLSATGWCGKALEVYNTRRGMDISIESRREFNPDLRPGFLEYTAACDVEDCREIESLYGYYQLEEDPRVDIPSKTPEEWREDKPNLLMFYGLKTGLNDIALVQRIRRLNHANVLSCGLPQIGSDGDYRNFYIARPSRNPQDFDTSKWLQEKGYLLTDFGELYGSIVLNSGRDKLPEAAKNAIQDICETYGSWVDHLAFENGMLVMVTQPENLAFGIQHFANVTSAVATAMEFIDNEVR